MKRQLYFFLLLLLVPICSFAGVLKGRVTDAKGGALPYATVYIQGTTNGVNAGADGSYELAVSPGTYKIVCGYVGFKQSNFNVSITGNETIVHNFSLQEEALQMNEVVIHANTEDPAYAIIRNAIKRRKFHLGQVRSFQTGVYLKGVMRSRVLPDKFMGQQIKTSDLGVDSIGKGILYLCEEDADYYSRGSDEKSRTVIHSVRESGDPNGFGFSHFPTVITFYENNINLFSNDPRGFISPISDGALNYYKYKLEGEYKENGQTIYKIKVTQKRLYEPCFNGTIYIADEDFAITGLNLALTKESGMDMIDTLKLDQLFLPLKKDVWVGKSQILFIAINILGFDVTANIATVYNNQKVNEPIPDSIFDNKITSIYDKAANKKDTAYWTESRPIALEEDEKHDFVIKDSIYAREQSPAYIDSIRKKQNRIKFLPLVMTGIREVAKGSKDIFTLNPLFISLGQEPVFGYNIVEGAVIAPKIGWVHQLDTGKALHIDVAARYGFSNKLFSPIGRVYYKNNDRSWHGKSWVIGAEGGQYVFQYNPENPVFPFYNTYAALLWHQNDLKIYERRDADIFAGRNYGNGFSWFVKASYQQRIPLQNTSDFSLAKGPANGFENDVPKHLDSVTGQTWAKHDAALIHAVINYQPGFSYTQYPDHKSGRSDWPVFTLTYDKGIPNILNSVVDYDKWRFMVRGDFRLRLLGSLSYNIGAGGFLNSNYVAIPDLMHLYGNRGIGYASPYLQSFQFAQYYDFSNKEPIYGEVHLEYNLGGLLSNKIPLLRQARWFFVMGTNTFYASQNDYYTEAFIGVDNIGWKLFRFLRVDFVQSWDSFGGHNSGIRFGLKSSTISVSHGNDSMSEW